MITKITDVKYIDEIMALVKKAVDNMISQEIYQWDDEYPNRDVLINDIENGNLFAFIDVNTDTIKGIMVLNQYQDEEYSAIPWELRTDACLVLHRLVVHPEVQGKGVAKGLLRFAEVYAITNNYKSIRLDTFMFNKPACRLYKQAGYEKRGSVLFHKGEFICFEKIFNLD